MIIHLIIQLYYIILALIEKYYENPTVVEIRDSSPSPLTHSVPLLQVRR